MKIKEEVEVEVLVGIEIIKKNNIKDDVYIIYELYFESKFIYKYLIIII
jgi:hypothetical protein